VLLVAAQAREREKQLTAMAAYIDAQNKVLLTAWDVVTRKECAIAEKASAQMIVSARVQEYQRLAQDKVKLDIGGKIVSTTRQFLLSFTDSLFAVMLGDRWPRGRDGTYFVDRTRTPAFDCMFNYMHTKELDVTRLSRKERDALIEEFDFYQVPPPPHLAKFQGRITNRVVRVSDHTHGITPIPNTSLLAFVTKHDIIIYCTREMQIKYRWTPIDLLNRNLGVQLMAITANADCEIIIATTRFDMNLDTDAITWHNHLIAYSTMGQVLRRKHLTMMAGHIKALWMENDNVVVASSCLTLIVDATLEHIQYCMHFHYGLVGMVTLPQQSKILTLTSDNRVNVYEGVLLDNYNEAISVWPMDTMTSAGMLLCPHTGHIFRISCGSFMGLQCNHTIRVSTVDGVNLYDFDIKCTVFQGWAFTADGDLAIVSKIDGITIYD
jgi:hypothetical protein